MDWKAALAEIRAALPPGSGAGGVQRGSLRWLEAELGARGGNPAALRNIVYRDVGTAADKRLLAELLRELAQEAGLRLDLGAPEQEPAPLPPELELLGRSKKRVYKQFLAGVRAGRTPGWWLRAAPGRARRCCSTTSRRRCNRPERGSSASTSAETCWRWQGAAAA